MTEEQLAVARNFLKDFEKLADIASKMSGVKDVKVYNMGKELSIGYGGENWIALKDDAFLWEGIA